MTMVKGERSVVLMLALVAGMLLANVYPGGKRTKRHVAQVGYISLLLLLVVVGARLTADAEVWASFSAEWWKGLAVGGGATLCSLYAGRLVLGVQDEEDA